MIIFAKKHTRSITYETIKHRTITNNDHFYLTIEKLIENLKQTFDKKNKKIKLMNEMFNFNFRINFKNKNEIFDEFLIRFNNLTILLRLNHIIKIKYFRDKLTKRMRYRMSHFKNCKN